MKRRRLSPRRAARKHNRARNKRRAINSPSFIMRGGIRL